MSKLRFDEINIGERFMDGGHIGIKNALFFCGGGPYNAVSCGFSGAGQANFPFFVTDDKEVELLTHMETYRVVDPGPQKGPSSVARINAQVVNSNNELNSVALPLVSIKKKDDIDPSFPSSSMGYL